MKVKPMINGIEVKVGQVWVNRYGDHVTVKNVNSSLYPINGVYCLNGQYYSDGHKSNEDLTRLVQDVETTYGETPLSFSAKLRKVQASVQPKATFTESEINAKINQVIKEFDWSKAAIVYTALNWTWFTTQGVPTIGDLVVAGIKRMKEAVEIAVSNQDEGYVSSGGLIGRAYITDGELAVSLEMQVTEAISY